MTLDARDATGFTGTPVFVATAQQLLGDMLRVTLDLHGIAVDLCTCQGAVAILDEAWIVHPGLVVVDIDCVGSAEAPDLIRRLVEQGATVLVLGAGVDRIGWALCLEAGATGVMSKESSFSSVLDAIRTALQGGTVTPISLRAQYIAELDEHRRERRSSTARFGDLTRRERDVLAQIVEGHSAAAIAERSFVSLATVRTQIRSILCKLGVNSQLAAAALARSAGWAHQEAEAA